jgi:U4/U6.U5 small nuclear ribonucleoproteins
VIQAQVDEGEAEEGETMDAVNDDDEDMMAMMGMTGFGSTKVLTSLSLPYYS